MSGPSDCTQATIPQQSFNMSAEEIVTLLKKSSEKELTNIFLKCHPMSEQHMFLKCLIAVGSGIDVDTDRKEFTERKLVVLATKLFLNHSPKEFQGKFLRELLGGNSPTFLKLFSIAMDEFVHHTACESEKLELSCHLMNYCHALDYLEEQKNSLFAYCDDLSSKEKQRKNSRLN